MASHRHFSAGLALLLLAAAVVHGSSFAAFAGVGLHRLVAGRRNRSWSRDRQWVFRQRSTSPKEGETDTIVDNDHVSLPLDGPASSGNPEEMETGGAEKYAGALLDPNIDGIAHLIGILVSLKEKLYAKIRQVLSDLVTIIKRSVKASEAWVRDDAVGQLVSSALALVAFFVAVAAFAAWNIELLGGKKWSGPADVTVPTVRVPQSTSSSGGVTFQKPKWKAPQIRTSYTRDDGPADS